MRAIFLTLLGGLYLTGCPAPAPADDDDGSPMADAGDDDQSAAADDPSDADACEALCEVVSDCEDVSKSDCIRYCEDDLDDARDLSSSCASAYGELIGCIAELSCSAYEDYWEEPTSNYPCHDGDEAVGEDCRVEDDGDTGEPEPDPEPDPEPEPQPDEDECDYDSQCGYHETCVGGRCQYAQCTSDAHCSGCNRCVSNYCSYCGEGPYGCYC